MLKSRSLLLAFALVAPLAVPASAAPKGEAGAKESAPIKDDPAERTRQLRMWYGTWSPEYRRFMNDAAAREREKWGNQLPGGSGSTTDRSLSSGSGDGALVDSGTSPSPSLPVGTPPANGAWINIGPTRSDFITNGTTLTEVDSGRPRQVVTHPTDPNIVYVGSSNGGVWKSTDGGATWTPKTETLGSLAVGDLAMDPSDPNTLYLGLGDPFDGTGIGLYKTTNGGDTWTGPVRC